MRFHYKHEDWKIENVAKDSEQLNINGDEHFGITDYSTNTIYMDESMVATRYHKILIHEITHVILNANGFFTIPHLDHEGICEFMSHFVFDVEDILGQIKENAK